MKTLLSILALSASLFASPDMSNMANVASCQKCHPAISKEFQSSMHKKSSIYDDKVHAAVWAKHPAKEKDKYICSKCHTPNAKTEEQRKEGITCLSCHTITDVKKHAKSNENVYTMENKTFYSAQAGMENEKVEYKTTTTWYGDKTTIGSAYHDVDYTNEGFYTGEMCMGCHSHKQNSHEFDVCRTEDAGAKTKKENCITCHMPQVGGSATTVRKDATHAFHGFAGAINEPRMLAKHVGLTFKKSSNGFDITVDNQAPHNLLIHPLRVVQLRATLIRDGKSTKLKTHTFVKAIGHEGQPTLPWLATEIVKDNMIKAKEKRVVSFDSTLKSGDKVEVVLGFFVVNPKVLKKLKLQDDKELTKFSVLKSKYFTIE